RRARGQRVRLRGPRLRRLAQAPSVRSRRQAQSRNRPAAESDAAEERRRRPGRQLDAAAETEIEAGSARTAAAEERREHRGPAAQRAAAGAGGVAEDEQAGAAEGAHWMVTRGMLNVEC